VVFIPLALVRWLMDEDSWEVLRHYIDNSTLARLIFNGLIGVKPFVSAAIVGAPGTGKTSYAYYSLKTAIIRALCHHAGVTGDVDACIKYIENHYGEVCMNRRCNTPDGVDQEYKWAYYTGVGDLKRFLSDMRELIEHANELKRKPILFLDDLVSRKAYSLGGEMRDLYQAFKEAYRVIRAASGVVLMTAIHRDYFPEEVMSTSEFAIARWGYNEIIYERWVYAKYMKRWYGDKFWFRALKPKWIDRVPRKSIFGLPDWLEREVNDRKIYTLKAVLDRVLNKKERKQKKAEGEAK
jgi:hypothetical protein